VRKLIVLDDWLHGRLKDLAGKKGLTVVGLIRMILTEYVKKHDKQ